MGNDDLLDMLSTRSSAAARAVARPAAMRMRLVQRPTLRMLGGSTKNYTERFGDHSWRQQNHIWTEAEIEERKLTADLKHTPQGLAETLLQKTVRASYHTFNLLTGYNALDP